MIAIAMVASKPSRYLAPLALVVAAGATVVVVTSQLHPAHHASAATTAATTTATQRHVSLRPTRSYVVKSGDTLSAIAAKTGVGLAAIEALNPGVNPSSLQTGQRLKLRR